MSLVASIHKTLLHRGGVHKQEFRERVQNISGQPRNMQMQKLYSIGFPKPYLGIILSEFAFAFVSYFFRALPRARNTPGIDEF